MNFQDIFEHTFRHLQTELKDKVVIDLPAGEGKTSAWLQGLGAKVIPLDLFPEFFKTQGLICLPCDLNENIPLDNDVADYVISQEGLEHVSDQSMALKEFSRILKLQGRLLLTCPNGSSLNAKISNLLAESERYARLMPPNMADSIWFNSQNAGSKLYYGHLFIPTASKIRVLAQIAGLELTKIHFSELKVSNFFWFILLYPLILLTQTANLLRNSAKKPAASAEYKKAFLLSINPKILLDGSLVLEFQKVSSSAASEKALHDQWQSLITGSTK
ncbi:MAG: class I SAM-dependent methyltransferase [Bdellovibrionaceae bacterium]|nr:class I SAM-dependent methyltransferase [Pseudobdellovibrionaceae bacterium]